MSVTSWWATSNVRLRPSFILLTLRLLSLCCSCYLRIEQVLDERDALLRNQLGSVKDGSSELAALTAEAEKLIKDARSEVSAMVNSKKSEKQAELDKVYNDAKMKVCYVC
jgi:F-type H+-transporting ATPase subunit b